MKDKLEEYLPKHKVKGYLLLKDIITKILKLEIKRNQFLIEWWEDKKYNGNKVLLLNNKILELKERKTKILEREIKEQEKINKEQGI